MTRRSLLLGVGAMCVGCGDNPDERIGAALTTTSTTPRPGPEGGFGSVIPLGTVDEVKATIAENDGFSYLPEARVWVVAYPEDSLDAARQVYDADTVTGLERGLLALYQKCTHLGCRVPACESSQRFECPCHGGVFSGVGEFVSGPAPRGMDRFPLRFDGDRASIDTTLVLPGLERGVATTDQDPAGPSCISP